MKSIINSCIRDRSTETSGVGLQYGYICRKYAILTLVQLTSADCLCEVIMSDSFVAVNMLGRIIF